MAVRRIKYYGNGYYISDSGDIISKKKNRKQKIIKQFINRHGYKCTVLRIDGCSVNFMVHRLVAQLFCRRKSDQNIVNHKDANRVNNHYSNLEWCTNSYNISYAYQVMGVKHNHTGKFGKDSVAAKPVDQLTIDGKFVKRWPSRADAAKTLKVRRSGISKCLSGEIKSSLGHKWREANKF